MTLFEFTTSTLRLPVSPAQGMLLAAIDGQPLSPEQADIFREAARREPTGTKFKEIRVIKGVRSGFTTMVEAPSILFRALYGDSPALGVQSVLPLVAQDARAARKVDQWAARKVDHLRAVHSTLFSSETKMIGCGNVGISRSVRDFQAAVEIVL